MFLSTEPRQLLKFQTSQLIFSPDARFPEFTKVELIFSSTADALHGSDYVPGATFPCELIDDPLIRWDSYEHFNDIIEGPEGQYNVFSEPEGH